MPVTAHRTGAPYRGARLGDLGQVTFSLRTVLFADISWGRDSRLALNIPPKPPGLTVILCP